MVTVLKNAEHGVLLSCINRLTEQQNQIHHVTLTLTIKMQKCKDNGTYKQHMY